MIRRIFGPFTGIVVVIISLLLILLPLLALTGCAVLSDKRYCEISGGDWIKESNICYYEEE